MKTKEEILREAGNGVISKSVALKAMDSHTSHLSERVKELEEKEDCNQRTILNLRQERGELLARIKELESESAEDDHVMLIFQEQCKIKDARIKELESQQQPVKEGWISVKDRLPEDYNDVLCFIPNNHRFVGNYTKGHEIEYWDEDYDGEYDPIEDKNGTLYLKPGWYECEETPGGEYDEVWVKRDVTHWQPLPSNPSPPNQNVKE